VPVERRADDVAGEAEPEQRHQRHHRRGARGPRRRRQGPASHGRAKEVAVSAALRNGAGRGEGGVG
jgi:hypothetical protein